MDSNYLWLYWLHVLVCNVIITLYWKNYIDQVTFILMHSYFDNIL